MRHAEVVLDSSDAHEFFDAGSDEIWGVVGIDKFRYAKNSKSVQEGDDGLDCSFVLSGVEHDKAGALFLHEENLRCASELTGLRNGHVVAVPSAKERCASEYRFVHCVRHLLF